MSTRYIWGRYNVDTTYRSSFRLYYEADEEINVSSGTWYIAEDMNFDSSDGSFSSTGRVSASSAGGKSADDYPYLYRSSSITGGNTGYINVYHVKTRGSGGTWNRIMLSGGYYLYVNQSNCDGYYRAYVEKNTSMGSRNAWVSSSSSSAYPSNAQSGSYWYSSQDQDNIDPSSVTIPSVIIPNQEVQITVTPSIDAQNNSYGTISYRYEYAVNGGAWTLITTSSSTGASFNVPANALSVQVRVRAQDNIGFTSSTYVLSDTISVATDALLNISGEDGDIGTVINDISFTVTSDVLSEAEVTVTIGLYTESFTATIGQEYFINIFDVLIAQGGSIVIVATGNYNGTQLNKTRSLIYTKSGQSFPSDNSSIVMLGDSTNPQYPLCVAEGVRVQGGVTLDVFLQQLQQQVNNLSLIETRLNELELNNALEGE